MNFPWASKKPEIRTVESLSAEAAELLAEALEAYGDAVDVGNAESALRHAAIEDLEVKIAQHEARINEVNDSVNEANVRAESLGELLV